MKTSPIKTIIISVSALVLFSVMFGLVLGAYESESKASSIVFLPEEGISPDHIAVTERLVSVDPVKGEMSVRLQFEPQGALLSSDGWTLANNLILDVNAASGKTEYTFKKGEAMPPLELKFDLWGKVSEYPFDEHYGEINMYFNMPVVTDPKATPVTIEYEDVPIALTYLGAVAGYVVNASQAPAKGVVGYSETELVITRTLTVVSFAVFIMLVKWLLALGALFVALSVAVRGRKVELAMFSWLAALLFALLPLRNAMPGVPPIGSLNDFLSFFWAEGIVALSLATIVFTWLRRPGAK